MGPPSPPAGCGASPLFGEDGGQPGPAAGNTHIGAMRRDPPRKHHGRQKPNEAVPSEDSAMGSEASLTGGSSAMNVDLARVQFAFTSINTSFRPGHDRDR